jgi:putative flavoprotein involved in K+ transport
MSEQKLTFDTVVIGGGQAGLATGYYLKQQQQDFVILDASERLGDVWRNRWDSLRLFTPASFNDLPGMAFPAAGRHFPTNDETGDFLESYAERFDLPVELGIRVDSLTRNGERFNIMAGDKCYQADNVVVAMSSYQQRNMPDFAPQLDPGILQLHSSEYRNPRQLKDGGVLVVGMGNSGAEIALDVAPDHPTWVSGQPTGVIPFRVETWAAYHFFIPFVLRFMFHRVLTVDTPIGRNNRPKALSNGVPLVRTKPKDLTKAGIERVGRTVGVQDGLPMIDGGQLLDVQNVIWCTGFRPAFSWIKLPIFGGKEHPKEPNHHRGIVADEPGLYFVGLAFLYALSSSIFLGIARDAEYVVNHLISRSN